MMLVGIGGADVADHVVDLCRDLRVLLADVPVQSEVMGVPRDDFAAVQLSLRPQRSAVEGLGNVKTVAPLPASVVVYLVLLELEMEIQPL